ncbi:MAG: 4Fe-4S binding protein [Planctomycetota bacterium]
MTEPKNAKGTLMSDKKIDLNALKAVGLIKQKDPGLFSVRLRVVGGRMESDHLAVLAAIARKYGRGHVHLTTRQGVEIPYVRLEDVDAMRADLTACGMELGVGGARVRTITACQGATCTHGLIDPQTLAVKIDRLVYGRGGLPHKFKIAITGCPNACIKPLENDLGIMGLARKVFLPERCTLCKLCIRACPVAGTLAVENGRLACHAETCIACGTCVATCPTGAWELTGAGYALFVGGKMGKRPRLANRLRLEVDTEEHVLRIVLTVLDWYVANGHKGERFGDTLDRVGVVVLENHLKAPGENSS